MIGCPVVALQGAVIAKTGEDCLREMCLDRGSHHQAIVGEIAPRGGEEIAASDQMIPIIGIDMPNPQYDAFPSTVPAP